MKQYEYNTISSNTALIEQDLNTLGTEGWELVSFTSPPEEWGYYEYVFKREKGSEEQRIKEKALDKPVDTCILPFRARLVLDNLNVHTYRDLVKFSRQELLRMRNFGEISLKHIDALLQENGLWYRMPI